MVISSLQSVTPSGDPRAVIETVAFQRLAAAQQARAFAFAALDIAQNVVAMGKLTSGPKLVSSANRSPARMRATRSRILCSNSAFCFAGTNTRVPFGPGRSCKVGHHGNIGGEVEVGIIGDNQRFAAQLHGDLFQ